MPLSPFGIPMVVWLIYPHMELPEPVPHTRTLEQCETAVSFSWVGDNLGPYPIR